MALRGEAWRGVASWYRAGRGMVDHRQKVSEEKLISRVRIVDFITLMRVPGAVPQPASPRRHGSARQLRRRVAFGGIIITMAGPTSLAKCITTGADVAAGRASPHCAKGWECSI